jgi:hypothetical protein
MSKSNHYVLGNDEPARKKSKETGAAQLNETKPVSILFICDIFFYNVA